LLREERCRCHFRCHLTQNLAFRSLELVDAVRTRVIGLPKLKDIARLARVLILRALCFRLLGRLLILWTREDCPVEARQVIITETAATPHPRLAIVSNLQAILQKSIMGCHLLNSNRGCSTCCPIVDQLLFLSVWKMWLLHRTAYSIVIESVTFAVRTLSAFRLLIPVPTFQRVCRCAVIQPNPRAEVCLQRERAFDLKIGLGLASLSILRSCA
jgi:hypothetical protein